MGKGIFSSVQLRKSSLLSNFDFEGSVIIQVIMRVDLNLAAILEAIMLERNVHAPLPVSAPSECSRTVPPRDARPRLAY